MNKIKMDLTKELPYAVEESINRLRINVSFLGNEIKKIMVVSTMPNEGKSFVTLQMWKQMASICRWGYEKLCHSKQIWHRKRRWLRNGRAYTLFGRRIST